MLEEPGFVLSLERPAWIIFGCRLDVVLTETNVDLRFGPAHRLDPVGRKHHLLAGPPVACIDHQVADRPCRVIEDRKSTRLNSSHSQISYAVFCLKKKKTDTSSTTGSSPCLARTKRC